MVPYDPNEADQDISKKNVEKGNQQLLSDILRFLEVFKDIRAKDKIQMRSSLAFPLCCKEDPKYLTKNDLNPNNSKQLLQKLGFPMENTKKTPDSFSVSIYQQVVSRYIGLHSTVPSKCASESFCLSSNMLGLAERNMESVFGSQVQNIQNDEFAAKKSLKNVCANDPLMKDVRNMLEQTSYRAKFESQHPKLLEYITAQDVKVDKLVSEYVFTNKKGHPIFGEAIKKVIEVVDDLTYHQGPKKILEYLKEKKISGISENGEELQMKKWVTKHVDNCSDCDFVQKLRAQYRTDEKMIQINESDILSVLQFTDRKHQGLREAYRRIKTWCDFPLLLERVRTLYHDDN